jgi:hypothetical protein
MGLDLRYIFATRHFGTSGSALERTQHIGEAAIHTFESHCFKTVKLIAGETLAKGVGSG